MPTSPSSTSGPRQIQSAVQVMAFSNPAIADGRIEALRRAIPLSIHARHC